MKLRSSTSERGGRAITVFIRKRSIGDFVQALSTSVLPQPEPFDAVQQRGKSGYEQRCEENTSTPHFDPEAK
jgi:hypothetical protein